jgi:hypothetical protein
LRRLQLVEGLFHLVGFSTSAFASKASELDSARLFVKRCWLRPRDFEWQARNLWDASAIPDITELIDALQDQGGSMAAVELLKYLDSLESQYLRQIPRGSELKYSLAEPLPQPTQLSVRATYDRKLAGMDPFQRAREVEKQYWQNPDSGLEDRVFRNYVVAGAYKLARRFYSQARENIIDPVGFSNSMGKTAYVVGYLLNDEKMRAMALEDSNSGSQSDMTIHIWDAAVRDNPEELKQNVKDIIERYEDNKGANSLGRRLLKFLPLLPALRDPNHSSRQQALRFFGKDEDWSTLRWIWIEKLKIPAKDAITLLGGHETGIFQLVLIRYLENDATKMEDALNQFSRSRTYIDEKSALAYHLYNKLTNHAITDEETDLRPADATSIRKAVLAKLKRVRE